MSDDKTPEDDAPEHENSPSHPEEQEEKGIGLTEEFARLEQEIKREVSGEDEQAEEEDPGDGPASEDADPSTGETEPEETVSAEVDDGESSGPVAPAAKGDTQAWSVDEAAAARESDEAAAAGEHQIPQESESPAAKGEPPEGTEAGIPEGAEERDEEAEEHTVVRRGPPAPIGAYAYDEAEDPEVKSPGLWWRFLTASVVIVVTVATATAVSLLVLFTNVAADLNPLPGLSDKLEQVDPGDPQTILLLGSDKRTNLAGDPGRSDTTMLLRVDPDGNILSLLSLPRDLKVDIAGRNYGEDKLNAAYADGGVKKTVATVQNLTGLKINHVVNVDFNGFAKAVDAIGCVYVDVDRHYFNDNSTAISDLDTFATINVNAGYQRLCGQNALDYVRYRHTDTDLVRSARQQDFLRNARAQVPISEVLPIIGGDTGSKLIDIFTNYTSSDIDSAAQIIGILQSFISVRDTPINQVKFDGELGPVYVETTAAQMEKMVDEFLNGMDAPGPIDDSKPKQRRSGKKKKDKGKPADGANVIPTSEALDPNTGLNKFEAFGRTSARRLDFPIYIPTKVVPGSEYSSDSRQYDIKDEDDKKQPAYKLVVTLPTDSGPFYYGVQGTTWSDPPILEHPSETISEDGRDYDIYYEGDRIRLVAWHDDKGNSYWVSNTLVQTVDNADMIAIAESMEQVKE
jgi:polyisoprenyl-teichoic acid--peptidoglycan teichoic acid transferase